MRFAHAPKQNLPTDAVGAVPAIGRAAELALFGALRSAVGAVQSCDAAIVAPIRRCPYAGRGFRVVRTSADDLGSIIRHSLCLSNLSY